MNRWQVGQKMKSVEMVLSFFPQEHETDRRTDKRTSQSIVYCLPHLPWHGHDISMLAVGLTSQYIYIMLLAELFQTFANCELNSLTFTNLWSIVIKCFILLKFKDTGKGQVTYDVRGGQNPIIPSVACKTVRPTASLVKITFKDKTRSLSVANTPCNRCVGQFCTLGTIFCGHYRSIFNHCDVIGLQSYRIRRSNAK